MGKPLAPYGKQYLEAPPAAGLVIAIGPDSWSLTHRWGYTVVVLPPREQPSAYRWPANKWGALVHETGPADDELLIATATQLLRDHNPFVVAIRHSLLGSGGSAAHFFYPEGAADGVAA